MDGNGEDAKKKQVRGNLVLADRLVSLAAAHGSMMQGRGGGADIQQCAFKELHNVTANVPAPEGWRVCVCVCVAHGSKSPPNSLLKSHQLF